MSEWTHVYGVIEVDTLLRTTEESIYWTKTIVNHLPKITGTELLYGVRQLPCYFSLVEGMNCSSSEDELYIPRNLSKEGLFEFQTKVLITIGGSCRNRKFSQTLKEVVKMLSKLGERIMVNQCFVRVQDDYGKKVIIDNPDWVINAEPTFWPKKYIKERYQENERAIYF